MAGRTVVTRRLALNSLAKPAQSFWPFPTRWFFGSFFGLHAGVGEPAATCRARLTWDRRINADRDKQRKFEPTLLWI